jgi:hypothetical protein
MLTLEDFEPCVGERFEIDSEPVIVELTLERIVKLPHGPGFLTRSPFNLIWSSAPNVNILLGVYFLRIPASRNRAWGPHRVYVEPKIRLGDKPEYQSVFF